MMSRTLFKSTLGKVRFFSTKESFQRFSVEECKKFIEDKVNQGEESGKVFLLDVREPQEIQELGPVRHLSKTANNLTLGEIADKVEKGDDPLKEFYLANCPDKQKDHVIVNCRGGVRSATAAELLTSLGYTNVISMEGGALAWFGRK